MSFDDLYPIIKEQAYYAVLRYEEPDLLPVKRTGS